jgi:Tol biopolymer transport system component
MLKRLLVLGVLLGLVQGYVFSEGIKEPIVVTQLPFPGPENAPVALSKTERSNFGEGARIVLLSPERAVRVLTEGFASASDANLSFDGKRILFAGKRHAEEYWNIFEMSLDGSEIRQITHDLGNCRSPVYQSTLYTIVSSEPWYQITFVSDAPGELNEQGGRRSTSLYSCRMDGSEVRRLTFNPSSDFDPHVMLDGRVLYSSWQRSVLEHGVDGRVSLFSVNSDGTDVAIFSGTKGERIKQMPCVTTQGLCVFVESESASWDGAGRLAALKLRRNLHSHETIGTPSNTLFHSPSPLPDGDLLASGRPEDNTGSHAVYRVDPLTGETSMVYDAPGYHDIQAQLVSPRPIPDGRSSIVNEADQNGQLYVLDSSISDTSDLSLDMVQRIRVLEGLAEGRNGPDSNLSDSGRPAPRSESPFIARRLLGEVPVEKDGSVFVEVPANIPIQLQLVDSDGMALRTCSWIWVKNREPRGCIGCHEDGEMTPPNRLVSAIEKPPYNLTLPSHRRRTVDFRRDVFPLVGSKCSTAACHAQGGSGPVLVLPGGNPDEEAVRLYERLTVPLPETGEGGLIGKFVHPGRARTSPLVWHIMGRNTSRPWDSVSGIVEAPPLPLTSPSVLSPLEKRVIIEWIDMGARWRGLPVSGSLDSKDLERVGGNQ